MPESASKLTAVALRSAWQYLIPSWGITILYLNFHFLARYFAGSTKFSEFGAEWNPRRALTGRPSIALKYAEMIALVFLDALVLLILLGIATLLGLGR